MKNFFLTATHLFFALCSLAQEHEKSKIISELHLQICFANYETRPANLVDFQKLAPNSSLLKNDFSSLNLNSNRVRLSQNYSTFQVGLNLRKFEHTKLRIGISQGSAVNLYSNYSRIEEMVYDTLTSSQTGAQYFLIASNYEGYSMMHTSDNLFLESSVIFTAFKDRRWSMFAGIGFFSGFSYHSETKINYFKYEYSASEYGFSYSSSNMNESQEEVFKNKSNFSSTFFIPLGVDFRIGKKREFWSKQHIYFEFKPSINVTSIPKIGSNGRALLYSCFGYKFQI